MGDAGRACMQLCWQLPVLALTELDLQVWLQCWAEAMLPEALLLVTNEGDVTLDACCAEA
jgi:hypothetical protein